MENIKKVVKKLVCSAEILSENSFLIEAITPEELLKIDIHTNDFFKEKNNVCVILKAKNNMIKVKFKHISESKMDTILDKQITISETIQKNHMKETLILPIGKKLNGTVLTLAQILIDVPISKSTSYFFAKENKLFLHALYNN